MRPTVCSALVLGGLLALLLLPGVVAAHEITHVKVDCADKSILISGESFGGEDGIAVTVTVSGPKGYVQSFVAEPRIPWTVSLPLGPSGTYTIRWPDPDGGSETFVVDCPDETHPPVTPEPTPTGPPATPSPTPTVTPSPTPSGTPAPTPSGTPGPTPNVTPSPSPSVTPSPTPKGPTPRPSKTPGHVAPTPDGTLPPTDATLTSGAVARSDTVLASLFFLAVFSIAVALRRAAQVRTRRR